MEVIQTGISGLLIIKPSVFNDSRGYFYESYSAQRYFNIGLPTFIQDNVSRSSYGVVRGLHYQLAPYAQSKLVQVLKGKVLAESVPASVSPAGNWFRLDRLNNLVMMLLVAVVFFWAVSHAKRKGLYIRRIAGLDAIDEAIGRATEMGKPIFYVPGIGDMTTVSTIAAAVPPALALGPGAETRVPMALVIIGGVSVSALLTLYVVPCAYSLTARLESRRHEQALKEALQELGELPSDSK